DRLSARPERVNLLAYPTLHSLSCLGYDSRIAVPETQLSHPRLTEILTRDRGGFVGEWTTCSSQLARMSTSFGETAMCAVSAHAVDSADAEEHRHCRCGNTRTRVCTRRRVRCWSGGSP